MRFIDPQLRNLIGQHRLAVWSKHKHYVLPYWRVGRRCSCIDAYRLLGASYAAALNILALKKPFFIRRISRVSTSSFPVKL